MRQSIADHAESLASAGRVAEAMRLLEPAAARDDGEALFVIALWLLAGQYLRRDLAASRDLFGRAGRAGRRDGAAIHLAFVANGTGGPADWPAALTLLRALAQVDGAAREQLALIDAMALSETGDPRAPLLPERLSDSPDLQLLRGLITRAECAYLIRAAAPLLAPAVVVDPRTGRRVANAIRTAQAAAFPLALENPAIHALNRRLARASGTDVRQGEPLQILAYAPRQEYRAHLDALTGIDNQRVLTVLAYLNADYRGGETRFLPDGPSVKGDVGDAIVFRNVDHAGRADPASRHAGLPVIAGRKFLASRWIRARPLDLGG